MINCRDSFTMQIIMSTISSQLSVPMTSEPIKPSVGNPLTPTTPTRRCETRHIIINSKPDLHVASVAFSRLFPELTKRTCSRTFPLCRRKIANVELQRKPIVQRQKKRYALYIIEAINHFNCDLRFIMLHNCFFSAWPNAALKQAQSRRSEKKDGNKAEKRKKVTQFLDQLKQTLNRRWSAPKKVNSDLLCNA